MSERSTGFLLLKTCVLLPPGVTQTLHSLLFHSKPASLISKACLGPVGTSVCCLSSTQNLCLSTMRTLRFLVMTNRNSHYLCSDSPSLHYQYFTILESTFSYRLLFTIENGIAKVHIQILLSQHWDRWLILVYG